MQRCDACVTIRYIPFYGIKYGDKVVEIICIVHMYIDVRGDLWNYAFRIPTFPLQTYFVSQSPVPTIDAESKGFGQQVLLRNFRRMHSFYFWANPATIYSCFMFLGVVIYTNPNRKEVIGPKFVHVTTSVASAKSKKVVWNR